MVIRKFPEIGEIKETLIKEGALGVLMSGSGPTIFGIAKNKDAALKIYSNIKSRYNLIWVVHTV
jgi:4-diphosphocytidyl-2-C-methyl-D-erythritol kinase